MTISATSRKAGPFIGNNTASTFAFAFKVFAAADLLVVTAAASTGAEATLELESDYSVVLNGDQDNNPGGSITLLAGPLATGAKLVITSRIGELQSTAVTNQSGFYPDVLNNSLDLVTVLVQQLRELATRTLIFPVTETAPAVALPPAPLRAGTILGFDGNGNLALLPIAPGGGVPGAQASPQAVDGQNLDFTFVAAAGTTPVPLVFVGGILQALGDDYSAPVFVSGSTWKITFTSPPVNGRVRILQFA